MKFFISLLILLFSFNIEANSDVYKCKGDLYILPTPTEYEEQILEFDFILTNTGMIFEEKNTNYLKIKNQNSVVKDSQGFYFTDSIENYSVIFSLNQKAIKFKYHYIQSNNNEYYKIISIGSCSIFDNN